MSDYEVTLRVRNGRLAAAIRQAGYPSFAAFARAIGIAPTALNELMCLRKAPHGQGRNADLLRPIVQKICDYLNAEPDELFPPAALAGATFTRNSRTVGMNEAEVLALIDQHAASPDPERLLIEADARARIFTQLDKLKPRERDVICMRFGLDPYDREHGYDEISSKYDLSGRERVRQIEAEAMLKLMRPGQSRLLREAARDLGIEAHHLPSVDHSHQNYEVRHGYLYPSGTVGPKVDGKGYFERKRAALGDQQVNR
jgi:hypothetical protein